LPHRQATGAELIDASAIDGIRHRDAACLARRDRSRGHPEGDSRPDRKSLSPLSALDARAIRDLAVERNVYALVRPTSPFQPRRSAP